MNSRSVLRLAQLLFIGIACLSRPLAWGAEAPPSTSVTGRISDAATGAFLENVRVAAEGTTATTVTGEDGAYRLTDLPPGPVTLSISYLGFAPQKLRIDVQPGRAAEKDITLVRRDGAERDEVVKLDAFNVVVDREMNAQALALNEQKNAANIKNVVALDEYGDRGQENIGEFMRFLPGVAVVDSGLTPGEISVRGLPGNTTTITVDGSPLADAQLNTRTVSAQSIPMGNISRVEVTKVPTPDLPADGLGGAVNVISKSGFERSKPQFNYQIYQLFNTNSGLTLNGGPRGQLGEVSPRYQKPSYNAGLILPVNKKLALTASYSSTWRKRGLRGRDETPTWDLINLFQRTSLWSHLRSIVTTQTAQAGLQWKLSPADLVTVNFQYKKGRFIVPRSQLGVVFGTGATGNADYTQGAATGVGTVTMGNGSNQATDTRNGILHLKYQHRGDLWEFSAGGSVSFATRRSSDVTNGHFNNVTSRLTNLVIRGDGIGQDGSTIPTNFTAVGRSGATVDIYDGSNYEIVSASTNPNNFLTFRNQGQIDLRRQFRALALKTGVAIDQLTVDDRAHPVTYGFRPNGSTLAADHIAGRFDVFDDAYNAVAPPVNGHPVRWISEAKLYQLFQQHPDWFVDAPATTYQNMATNSKKFLETISAAYVRTDVKWFSNKLWITTGVRFEKTDAEGNGVLNDPSALYQKDASGAIIRNNGKPVLVTTDPLLGAQLRYQERAAKTKRSYDGWFPSLNATYNITENLLLRAGYAKTIGRPNLSFIIPGVTVPDPTSTSRTITVVNTGLKPWTANNYDLSLESYQLKGGVGTVGLFQKDIQNFFDTTTMEATPELAAQYGIPPEVVFPDSIISTRTNGGDARIRGVEFMYRQSLLFLPHWARGFQAFINVTKLQLAGDRSADFGSFTPSTVAWGVSLIRPRYSIKFTSTHQGETQRGLVAASVAGGIPEDTYNYQGARTRYTLSAEFSFSKHFSIYGSLTDIGGFDALTKRYAPDTPEYARVSRYQELGATAIIGVQGQF